VLTQLHLRARTNKVGCYGRCDAREEMALSAGPDAGAAWRGYLHGEQRAIGWLVQRGVLRHVVQVLPRVFTSDNAPGTRAVGFMRYCAGLDQVRAFSRHVVAFHWRPRADVLYGPFAHELP